MEAETAMRGMYGEEEEEEEMETEKVKVKRYLLEPAPDPRASHLCSALKARPSQHATIRKKK
jgi:hypothetical protein